MFNSFIIDNHPFFKLKLMQFRNFSKYFIITGKVLVALRIKRGSELKAYESAVLPTEHFFVANLAFFFATNKQRKSSEQ
jgi:hypothetical protein